MNTHTLRDIKTVSRETSVRDSAPSLQHTYEPREYEAPTVATADGEAAQPTTFLEKLPFFLMLTLVFLLPLFVVPTPAANFNISKMLFATLAVGLAFGSWVLVQLKSGVLTVPRTFLSVAVFCVPIAFAIAALFSDVPSASFIGQGFEPGTVFFLALSAIVFFLGVALFSSASRVFAFHLALLAAFVVTVLFQGSRFLFGYDFLSFGVFDSSIANLIGKWNDLGIFAGLGALLSLATIELVEIRGAVRAFLYAALVAAIGLLMVVNFRIVWITLAVFVAALAAFIMRRARNLSHSQALDNPERAAVRGNLTPILAFVVIGIAVLFSIVGQPVGEWAARKLDISHLEARPSFVSTVNIARETLTTPQAILVGVGPNRFIRPWLLYKPVELNLTPFWSIDFNFGVGLLPTFVITTGLVGVIGLLLFFIPWLASGLGGIRMSGLDRWSTFTIVSSFLGALFLWALVAVYVPNGVIVMLAFLFSGVAIGAVLRARTVLPRTFAFGVSKFGFIVSLFLVLLLGGVVWSGYIAVGRFVAAGYFGSAARALESGDVKTALAAGSDAVRWAPLDVHHRLLAQAGIARMREIVVETSNGEEAAEPLRAEFRTTLEQAVEHARASTDIDPNSYENWAIRGLVYGVLVPFGVEGAFENAESAYKRAIELNPKNPALYLAYARVAMEHGDYDAARSIVGEALSRKGNYTEAAFFLSQLEVRAGNLQAAKQSAEAAVALNQDDPLALFQLGLLRYNDEEYGGAIAALERAVSVNSSYSNARYFLGLSYAHENRTDDAIAQFVEIEKFNPDNAEVKSILVNLRAGRDAFAGEEAKPEPEERDKLPIDEDN